MKIRGTKVSRVLRLLYNDIGYIYINTIVNHIPSWSIRKILYRLAGMKLGSRSRVGIGTKIICPKGIIIGDGCIVNEYCHLDGRGGLRIDNDVSISIYTKIITASHALDSEKFEYESGFVHIHDHSFLGTGVIVLQNSEIERGCVLGAGCVAKGNYAANTYYVGNPAKRLRDRKSECNYSLKHEAFFR